VAISLRYKMSTSKRACCAVEIATLRSQ